MGLMILPGGWPEGLAEYFEAENAASLDEVELRRRAALCEQMGRHVEHVCPNCGDRSCLRCRIGLNP